MIEKLKQGYHQLVIFNLLLLLAGFIILVKILNIK